MLGYTMIDMKERERQVQDIQIYPAEMIILSGAKLWESIGNGLFGGCIGILFFGLFVGSFLFDPHSHSPITSTFVRIFGFYVGAVLLLVILNSLSGERLDKSALFQPNQGIRRSIQNSLLVGALSGGVVGTVVGVITGVEVGVITGVGVGVIVGLHKGGFASIQHFLLRWFLWKVGSIPWNSPRFFDYAAERILLRKVGGGYIFVHRLLLEYFAELDTMPKHKVRRQ
jgi:hypothetical protein